MQALRAASGHPGRSRPFTGGNHRSEAGEHQNQLTCARLGWGWWQLHTNSAASAKGTSDSHKVPLLGSLWSKRREWNGKRVAYYYMPCCSYVGFVTEAQSVEEEGGPAVGKENSPTILSILIDGRIKKYGHICSAQWYGTALSTLCSSILFTYMSKICM